MKVRLVDSKDKEIDVSVELEKVVAEWGTEVEANPGEVTTKMLQLMEEIGEISGLEPDKIKAEIIYEATELGKYEEAKLNRKVEHITLCFLD